MPNFGTLFAWAKAPVASARRLQFLRSSSIRVAHFLSGRVHFWARCATCCNYDFSASIYPGERFLLFIVVASRSTIPRGEVGVELDRKQVEFQRVNG
jgi:hypothetical protein